MQSLADLLPGTEPGFFRTMRTLAKQFAADVEAFEQRSAVIMARMNARLERMQNIIDEYKENKKEAE